MSSAKKGGKKAAKKSASRNRSRKRTHEHVGQGARYLQGAAAGYATGRIVAHDGAEASIEHADGSVVRRKAGEYELV
jgi:hypothetical protein